MKPALEDPTSTDVDADSAACRAVYLTQPDDIAPMLKVLRDHSADLELRIGGVDGHYRGRVLDLGDGEFLLEDIRPRDGLVHLRRGTRFSFASRIEDLYIYGEDCRVTGVESERGLPYFRAKLPKRLLRHRRRRHARITLPPRVEPDDGTIWITRTHASADLRCRIIDISVGGARVAFNGAVLPNLQNDEVFPNCQLRVSRSLAFETSAVVRHAAWDAAQRLTVCGIEFTGMTVGDRRRLEHYVSQLTGRSQKA